MRIDVVSIFPQMFDVITDYGITHQAFKKNLFALNLWNPRDYSEDKHQRVDDRPYGGGPGMVMMAAPLAKCVEAIWQDVDTKQTQTSRSHVVYLSPQGQKLTQKHIGKLTSHKAITLVCGRYEGVDERFIHQYVDEELSLGDFILAGGEIGAMAVIEACVRMLPDALGNSLSADQDSFSNDLLDWPHFTRPEIFQSEAVPEVLLSGNHAHIEQWRQQQSLQRTAQRRADLLENWQKNQK